MRAGDDFERRPRARRAKAPKVRVSRNDRAALKEFLRTRQGVEAYVEPRTLARGLSVALVASDGESLRVTLPDDSWLRRFARKRALPIYDAGVMGYPKRMREYGRGEEDPAG
jgi:hypothetical protein